MRSDCIYDAHMHFPIKQNDPYGVLKRELTQNNVTGGVLILNTPMEKRCFFDNLHNIINRDLGFLPEIAFLVDGREVDEEYLTIINMGFACSLKIHPRISNIEISDFNRILNRIKLLDYNAVIVDDWIYGPRIKNHIGTELAIFLAEELPDSKIVIAHSGGINVLKTMVLTRPINNIFYDLSNTCCYLKGTSVEADIIHFLKYTSDRIMYGSDYPDFSIGDSIRCMYEYLENAKLDVKEKENVLYKTAKKIYT